MALSITSVTRENGGDCNHLEVTIDHEGTPRTFRTSFGEIDRLLDAMTPAEQGRLLVLLWAAYRRRMSRSVVGVPIA